MHSHFINNKYMYLAIYKMYYTNEYNKHYAMATTIWKFKQNKDSYKYKLRLISL